MKASGTISEGGHFWHFETHMRDFYRALGRGEGAVILCETPAQTMEDGLQTEFREKLALSSAVLCVLPRKPGGSGRHDLPAYGT